MDHWHQGAALCKAVYADLSWHHGLRFKPSITNLSLQPHFLSKMHTSYAASRGHSTAGYKHYKPTLIYWLKWKKNDGNEGQTDTVQQDSFLFAVPLLWAPVMNVNARIITLLYYEFFNREDLVSLCKIYGTTLRNTTTMCTSRRRHYNERGETDLHPCHWEGQALCWNTLAVLKLLADCFPAFPVRQAIQGTGKVPHLGQSSTFSKNIMAAVKLQTNFLVFLNTPKI